VLVDVGFEDEGTEFAPSNIRRLAADKPPKEFKEESMLYLSPSGTRIAEGGLVAWPSWPSMI
jgi:hypothetical protein